MNTTRRMFSRWFAAVPVAAGVLVGSGPRAITPRPAPPPIPTGFDMGAKTPFHIPDPPGVAQYWKAREEINRMQHYRRMLGDARHDVQRGGMPPSIDCLKSVSNIHKYHMIAQRHLASVEAERTFTEQLLDKFGVRDWFKKQHGGMAQVERAGMGSTGF